MTAYPKDNDNRNQAVLDLARSKECLLNVPNVCNNDTLTTVAAHSNQLRHGKGRGRKAGDQWTVWACARCHSWLDGSYSADRQDKQEAFAAGHAKQIDEWIKIAAGQTGSTARAARWALDRVLIGEQK
jgi:hypothetical protein